VALIVINQGIDPENVFALKGGFEAWTKAGYPTAAGGGPWEPHPVDP